MKVAILLVALLCVSAFALGEKSKFQSKLSALLKSKAQATDAVDTVLNLLNDLRQSEVDEQNRADENNATEEEEGLSRVASLNGLVEENKAIAEGCTASRENVEDQIEDTLNRIAFINNRLEDIPETLEDLASGRCAANAIFVDNLQEHQDALTAIELLKRDFSSSLGIGGDVEFSQIKDLTERFKKYEHLFESEAINSFISLSQDVGVRSDSEIGGGHLDNDREGFQADSFNSASISSGQSLAQRVYSLVLRLEEGLKTNLKNLEQHEIQAAYDYLNYRRSLESELATLRDEGEEKQNRYESLAIELEVAEDYEERCWSIYRDAVATLDNAVDELDRRRENYASETARRNNELEVLDAVIRIFSDRIAGLQGYLRERINDFDADKTFEDSGVARATDTFQGEFNWARFGGPVDADVEAAAEAQAEGEVDFDDEE